MRIPRTLLVILLAALLFPWPGSTALANDDGEIAVLISPKAIMSFATRSGNWVTVHADISYALVEVNDPDQPLLLNGVEVEFAKPDDSGDLVAKVRLTDLLDTLFDGKNVLTFAGWPKDDEPFFGDDKVFVRSTKPGKKK